MKAKIKLLSEAATMPTKATPGSAALDLYLPRAVAVAPRSRQAVPLDITMEFPPYLEAKIEPRSGFSAHGLPDERGGRHDADVLVGKIDSDYRGNVSVIIANHSDDQFTISACTRIAQLTFYGLPVVEIERTDTELSATTRGDGGLGHTGA